MKMPAASGVCAEAVRHARRTTSDALPMGPIIGHHRSVRLPAALTAVMLATAMLPPQQRPPLRSTIEVIVVTATVRDANGRLVGNLPKDAFSVYEDGEPMAITTFTNERVPLGIGLL